MSTILLAAEVGAFPTPLVRVAWALREAGHVVREVHVLTHGPGRAYVPAELDAPLAALAASGGVPPSAIVTVATGPDGRPLGREGFEASPRDWFDARWRFFRGVRARAGDDPLVYALAGGRQRSTAAATASMFTMLARERDRCVEARTSHPKLESHLARPAFAFPGQGGVVVGEDDVAVPADAVSIALLDVPLPRVRDYVEDPHADWDQAFAGAAASLAEAAPGTLVLHLAERRVWLGGTERRVSADAFAWLLTLATGGTGGRRVGTDDVSALEASLRRMADADRGLAPRHFRHELAREFLRDLRREREPALRLDASLRKLRFAAAKQLGAALGPVLVQEGRGTRSAWSLAEGVRRVVVR